MNANDDRSQVRTGLAGGGRRIRTISPRSQWREFSKPLRIGLWTFGRSSRHPSCDGACSGSNAPGKSSSLGFTREGTGLELSLTPKGGSIPPVLSPETLENVEAA